MRPCCWERIPEVAEAAPIPSTKLARALDMLWLPCVAPPERVTTEVRRAAQDGDVSSCVHANPQSASPAERSWLWHSSPRRIQRISQTHWWHEAIVPEADFQSEISDTRRPPAGS